MEKKFLSRQYLESMSTSDLIALADDYGIDIPDNLNRRFIIGELLEAGEELTRDDKKTDDEVLITEAEEIDEYSTLPQSYNDTSVNVLLSNPAWAYVYWDIREADLQSIKEDPEFSHLSLSVVYFEDETSEEPVDSFEVQIGLEDREQYILISGEKNYFCINLKYNTSSGNLTGSNSVNIIDNMDGSSSGRTSLKTRSRIMATSRRVLIPSEDKEIAGMQPGKKLEMSELVRLSGMEKLLHDHYENHRQSFEK